MAGFLPRVVDVLAGSDWTAEPVDQVALDYDDRFRRRIVLSGETGLRFLLELSEPRLLQDGDGLRLDNGGVVAVIAAPERLAEIVCDDVHHLVRVAWHLGNRHLPTQILDGRLRIREDHVIIDMVEKLGATVRLIDAPFEPEGGAYGHGQVHSHDHPHAHEHGREHAHGSANGHEHTHGHANAHAHGSHDHD